MLELAERLRELQLLRRCELLIAEEQHLPFEQRVPDLVSQLVVEGAREVHAVHLGPDDLGVRLELQAGVRPVGPVVGNPADHAWTHAPRHRPGQTFTIADDDSRMGSDLSPLLRLERTRTGSPVSSIDGKVAEQLLEEHPALEPGEVHAEAEVLGDAERQVRVGRAVDVEALRVVEHVLVAVGRRVVHRHLVARPDRRRRAARCRRWRCAGSSAAGWPSAGSPRPRPGSSDGSARSSASWSGCCSSAQQARRQHRLGGVVAGGDELHEEAAEVDVGHRAGRRSRRRGSAW